MTSRRALRRCTLVVAAALASLLLLACGAEPKSKAEPSEAPATTSAPATPTPTPAPTTTPPSRTPTRTAPPRPVKIVAAGDIACPPGGYKTSQECQQDATAALAERLAPDLVLALGDEQYQAGTGEEFKSYDASWGALLDRTWPVPGNHEYFTGGAAGYYSYFRGRQPGPPGYYRVQTRDWQMYLLNSNCDRIDCGAEARWLDDEMAAHPSRCSLVAMHHPRFSSGGEHGDDPDVLGLWRVAYEHHTDLVLAGHDHDYERFLQLDPGGQPRTGRGMQEIVSGTGGRSLYPEGKLHSTSAYFQNKVFGVVELGLSPTSWTWRYVDITNKTLDSGMHSCV